VEKVERWATARAASRQNVVTFHLLAGRGVVIFRGELPGQQASDDVRQGPHRL